MSSKSATRNRLARETSPYLLQHAANPVDWYPWGPEALERARELQQPIFLSIGYSACHWCHVMERESFEDQEIAELLNRSFVSIKVDREERPDLDDIYMKAVQALSGAGGWPMSVFLTPELQPFFGGTYFPPDDRYGRPGFPKILRWVEKLWKEERERVLEQARTMTSYITAEASMESVGALDPDVLDRSLRALEENFDPRWGGFGAAPKFPHALDLRLLLRHGKRTGDAHATEMALLTLDRMAQGGIYDQLAGGFARYSTDEKWLIPHFEKMLYDNALLVPAYLEAFLVTREERFARIARQACDWVLGEMVTAEGGFASSLDADSEGEEGKFYAWTRAELDSVLGPERAKAAAAWFGVTEAGNFEHGKNALWRPRPDEEVAKELGVEPAALRASMESARADLLRAREQRVRPGKDDKVLAAWNGLMISALAQAYQALAEPRFLEAARRAAGFVLEHMRQPDGRLFATARNGRAHVNACLDDYAFVIQALLDLYESDFDPAWIREALALDRVLSERFVDEERGGYFTTGVDHEKLIARLRSPVDGALPSGNGVQALNLLRLSELTGDGERAAQAERTLRSVGSLANRYPQGFSQLLLAVDHLAAGPRELVIAGEDDAADVERMLALVRSTFLPQRVVARAHKGADAELVPLVAGKTAPAGSARAFVCRNYTCGVPARTPEELAQQLET